MPEPLPVFFAPEAEQQLVELEKYLSKRFYPESAKVYVRKIVLRCISIGLAPYQGTARDDLRPGTRTTGFERRIMILFQSANTKVTILGVFYGGSQPRL